MSSLITNFFVCPILVMNLVFRHYEQEQEAMSWAEEVEEMQPSKSFAFLFNWSPGYKIYRKELVWDSHSHSH